LYKNLFQLGGVEEYLIDCAIYLGLDRDLLFHRHGPNDVSDLANYFAELEPLRTELKFAGLDFG